MPPEHAVLWASLIASPVQHGGNDVLRSFYQVIVSPALVGHRRVGWVGEVGDLRSRQQPVAYPLL